MRVWKIWYNPTPKQKLCLGWEKTKKEALLLLQNKENDYPCIKRRCCVRQGTLSLRKKIRQGWRELENQLAKKLRINRYIFDEQTANIIINAVCGKYGLPIPTIKIYSFRSQLWGRYFSSGNGRIQLNLNQIQGVTYQTLLHELAHHFQDCGYYKRWDGFCEIIKNRCWRKDSIHGTNFKKSLKMIYGVL